MCVTSELFEYVHMRNQIHFKFRILFCPIQSHSLLTNVRITFWEMWMWLWLWKRYVWTYICDEWISKETKQTKVYTQYYINLLHANKCELCVEIIKEKIRTLHPLLLQKWDTQTIKQRTRKENQKATDLK